MHGSLPVDVIIVNLCFVYLFHHALNCMASRIRKSQKIRRLSRPLGVRALVIWVSPLRYT